MANDNHGSRTFLAIVLGGIVLALVIAAYFMYGNKDDRDVRIERPAVEQVPGTPPQAEPAPEEIPPASMPPAEAPPSMEVAPETTPSPTPN